MRDAGYRDFDRGALGSTAEHLSSLQYQIKEDQERLYEISEEAYISGQKYSLLTDELGLKKHELDQLKKSIEK